MSSGLKSMFNLRFVGHVCAGGDPTSSNAVLRRICSDESCFKAFVFVLNMVIGYRAVVNDVQLVVSLVCAPG